MRTIAELRRKTVGVSSAGSPSQFYLNYLLVAAKVSPMKWPPRTSAWARPGWSRWNIGQVAAAMLFGSAITAYQARQPDAAILADSRSPEGLKAVFGVDDYPASSFLATAAWLETESGDGEKAGGSGVAFTRLDPRTFTRRNPRARASGISCRRSPRGGRGDPARETHVFDRRPHSAGKRGGRAKGTRRLARECA